MSYDKIRSLAIVKDEDGSYFVRVTSAESNVTDWNGNYCWNKREWYKGKGKTKEELEKEILHDYFYGNLQGGSNRFSDYVNICGSWKSGDTTNSRKPSQIYQKYDILGMKAYKLVKSMQESPKEWELYKKIQARLYREVERVLYDDFKAFCSEDKKQTKTILELLQNNNSRGYVYVGKGQRTPRLVYDTSFATVYTDSLKMNKVISKLENWGYTVNKIEVA